MKEMRRLLSFLLVLVMVVGFVPANAFAAETETPLDAAIFCSDVHGDTTALTNVFSGVAKSGLTFSSVSFNGDTCLKVANTTSTVSAALGQNPSILFSYAASHDTENSSDIGTSWDFSGEAFENDNYIVYTIRENDMRYYENATTAAASFVEWAKTADTSKPLFIISHRPLHARRNDNAGASTWFNAIYEVAKTMDVVFFWAHNHTSESDVDIEHYYIAKGGQLYLNTSTSGSSVELSDEEELALAASDAEAYAGHGSNSSSATGEYYETNFTYMNAGYIDANNQSPARIGVATTVQIYEDKMVFQDYNSSGAYTGTYAHNVTVDFTYADLSEEEVVVVTPAQLVVTGTSEYTVGDTFEEPTVTVTYSDGTSKDVTDYSVDGMDELNMNAAGTYTLIYTYSETVNGQTYAAEAQFTVTVKEAETGTVNTVTGTDEDTHDVVTAVGEGLTGVTLTHNTTADTDGFHDCIVYDVALEGYVEGTTVTLTFDIAYMDSTDLVVYDANGNQLEIVSVEDVTVDDELYTVQVTVEVNSASGTYIIGKLGASEGAVITGIEVGQQPETTGYTLVDLNADNDIYLDITGLVINAVYDDGSRVPLDWNQFDEEKDGYALSFDINVVGVRTVTVTYGGFETSFVVTVYDTETVDMATDETVTAAVADVLTGEFVALDITLKDYVQGTKVHVVMPAPENANVVYHVAEDGTLTKIEGVTFHGGHAIFDTDHFSIYVAGTEQNSAQVSVPFTVSGTKTVYVLTSGISSGNSYLIANSNSASSATCYLLANNNGSEAATGVTIKSGDVDGDGDNETYIELTDATDELWTVSNGYRFQNNGYYLHYSNNSLGLSTSNSTNWSYSNNRLSCSSGGGSNNRTYHLQYSNGWQASTSTGSVYFYIPTTVNYDISGDVTLDAGADQTVVYDSSKPTVTINPTVKLTESDGTVHTPDLKGTYSYSVVEDPNGIFTGVSDSNANNVFTLNAVEGTATIRVYYTWEDDDGTTYTVYDDVTITTSLPYYTVDIVDENGKTVTSIIALKSVTEDSNTTLTLDALVKYINTTTSTTITEEDMVFVGADYTGTREYGKLYWTANDFGIVKNITFSDGKATVSFTGTKDGAVNISVFYLPIEGGTADDWIYDTITVTTSSNEYYTPADGPEQFPDYPNEGSVNINKTATAVGNFSETGIAQIELYGNGIPVSSGGAIDVVLMLDVTGSMGNIQMKALFAATKTFLESITDKGTNLKNNVAVGFFNNAGVLWMNELEPLTADEYNTIITYLSSTNYNYVQTSGGTPYSFALKAAHDQLAASTSGYEQYLVFLSDGAPKFGNSNAGSFPSNGQSMAESIQSLSNKANSDIYYVNSTTSYGTAANIVNNNFPTEYWSNDMKTNDGVEIYTVGLDIATEDSVSADNLKKIINNLSSGEGYYKQVAYDDNGNVETGSDDLSTVFQNIAETIKAAASDVTVYDQITDNYELIFELPDAITDRLDPNSKNYDPAYSDPTGGQEFYIEVVNYKLDSSYNRTGEAESLLRVYLSKTDGQITASACTVKTAADGTENETAVATTYTAAASGETGYFTLSNGVYTYVAAGVQTTDSVTAYNIDTGAYAQGTSNDDMIIVTPYFTYTAATRSFLWTTDELGKENQIALRYFVYLTDSLENMWDEISGNEIPAGPYNTNTVAWIAYTNHNDKLCYQYFPVPQLTWNGAQVTYVFYLVNSDGLPVNKAGTVIPFSNAVEVTDRYTQSVVWNDDGSIGSTELHVNWLAEDKLPDYYKLYDEAAAYEIRVYKDENGVDRFNYFVISGDKAINGDDDGNASDKDYSTKVYIDKSSTKYDVPGTYTAANVYPGFDFSDTTVAFAVLWTPELQSDVVVVDFGLDVVINVTTNDYLANSINGIGAAKPDGAENTAVLTGSTFGKQAITVDNCTVTIENGNEVRVHQNSMEFDAPVKFYYDSKVNYTQGGATFDGYMYSSVTVIPATTVYYEDEFVDLTTYTRADSNSEYEETAGWASAVASTGAIVGATQAQDRPGDSKLSFEIDADNVYGYDAVYDSCSEYSMGSAAKISVNANQYGTAEFSFYGTGFDVISMTSNTTGTLIVQVYGYDEDGNMISKPIKTASVDTYYGYTYGIYEVTYTLNEDGKWEQTAIGEALPADSTEKVYYSKDELTKEKRTENEDGSVTATGYIKVWKAVENDPNALYQVPVMKISGLDYGKYTAKISALYYSSLDHTTGTDGYDLYLDAIRIYDPAGTNKEANDAYIKDGEGYPEYVEVRNEIIKESGATVTPTSMGRWLVELAKDENGNEVDLNGFIFIDGNANNDSLIDYVHYGPNNEVYLTNKQAVTFNVDLSKFVNAKGESIVADVQVGLKLAYGDPVYDDEGNVVSGGAVYQTKYQMYNALTGGAITGTQTGNINTATEMYYSIKDLLSGTVVITNTGDGILSITNLKITFTEEPASTIDVPSVISIDGESATNAVNSLSYVKPSTANFDPETMDISFNRTTASVGNNVIVTVTTSDDVKDLLVNGKIATNKTTSYLTGETTWSFTVPVEDNGSLKVTVVGYDAYGEYTVPYSESVTVINQSGTAEDLLGKLFG